jgi:hypothetical protein
VLNVLFKRIHNSIFLLQPVNKFIHSSGKEYDSNDKEKEVRFEEKLEEFFSESKLSDKSISPTLDMREKSFTNLAEQKPLKSCLKPPKKTDTEEHRIEHNDGNKLLIFSFFDKLYYYNSASRFVHSNTLFFLEVPKVKLPPSKKTFHIAHTTKFL